MLGLLPRAALAHAVLLDSDPAPMGEVAAGRHLLRLRFNSRIDAARSRLSLVDPQGVVRVLAILKEGAAPDLLTAEAVLAPGAWELRWQVLAIDGHITRGLVPFSVKTP